jgi:hypothetical protein
MSNRPKHTTGWTVSIIILSVATAFCLRPLNRNNSLPVWARLAISITVYAIVLTGHRLAFILITRRRAK